MEKLSRKEQYRELREHMKTETIKDLEEMVEELSEINENLEAENQEVKDLIISILKDIYTE